MVVEVLSRLRSVLTRANSYDEASERPLPPGCSLDLPHAVQRPGSMDHMGGKSPTCRAGDDETARVTAAVGSPAEAVEGREAPGPSAGSIPRPATFDIPCASQAVGAGAFSQTGIHYRRSVSLGEGRASWTRPRLVRKFSVRQLPLRLPFRFSTRRKGAPRGLLSLSLSLPRWRRLVQGVEAEAEPPQAEEPAAEEEAWLSEFYAALAREKEAASLEVQAREVEQFPWGGEERWRGPVERALSLGIHLPLSVISEEPEGERELDLGVGGPAPRSWTSAF